MSTVHPAHAIQMTGCNPPVHVWFITFSVHNSQTHCAPCSSTTCIYCTHTWEQFIHEPLSLETTPLVDGKYQNCVLSAVSGSHTTSTGHTCMQYTLYGQCVHIFVLTGGQRILFVWAVVLLVTTCTPLKELCCFPLTLFLHTTSCSVWVLHVHVHVHVHM